MKDIQHLGELDVFRVDAATLKTARSSSSAWVDREKLLTFMLSRLKTSEALGQVMLTMDEYVADMKGNGVRAAFKTKEAQAEFDAMMLAKTRAEMLSLFGFDQEVIRSVVLDTLRRHWRLSHPTVLSSSPTPPRETSFRPSASAGARPWAYGRRGGERKSP